MTERVLVSIIIPNYNKRDHLKKCLESVFKQTYKDIEVIVVDNGSIDGSYELIEKYQTIKLIKNSRNELFARSVNKGIRVSRGRYVLCLNNDVMLMEDFIERLMNAAYLTNEKVGIFTGRILSHKGDSIDSCGQILSKSRRAEERGYGKKDPSLYSEKEIVFGACAAAVFFKKNMLDEIAIKGEYFDEDFGIFLEDLDINWRANNSGWKALYVPDAICFHKRGTTTLSQTEAPRACAWSSGNGIENPILSQFILPNIPKALQVYFIRNRYLAIIKNDSPKKFFLNLPFIILYELKIWLYVLFFRPQLFLSIFSYPGYFRRAFKKRAILKAG